MAYYVDLACRKPANMEVARCSKVCDYFFYKGNAHRGFYLIFLPLAVHALYLAQYLPLKIKHIFLCGRLIARF